MRVAQIDVNYLNSSTGKIVNDLHLYTLSHNSDSRVYYGRGAATKIEKVIKFGIDFETYLHAIMTRLTGITGYFSYFSTKRLIRKLNKFKPDIIHIHELHAYFINIERIIKYIVKKNIPIVWTFHCEFMYTGKCGHALSCEKWKTTCGKCPQKKKYPKSLFFDFTTLMHNRKKVSLLKIKHLTIVTPSEWMANRVRLSFLKNYDIRVVNNGVNLLNFTFDNKHHNYDKTNYIFTAIAPNVMSEEKGGQWVIEIAKAMQNSPIKFRIIGDTAKTVVNMPNIEILPKIFDQERIAQYYKESDVFLIFSKRENYPTTVIEALSCGVPVIGFKNGGAEEMINDKCGILLEQGNISGIINILNDFVNKIIQFDTRESISNYAKSLFDNTVMGKRYLEIYEEVIRNRS